MTTPNRAPRDTETRALKERPKQWMPPELLPEPDKQAGYTYRWVRTSTLNVADPKNVTKMMLEGWEPVQVEEQPHYRLLNSPNDNFKGCIEIGGLMLCKIPTEFMEQRKAHYDKLTKDQMEGVDNNYMRQNDSRMPLFNERRSKTTFGKG